MAKTILAVISAVVLFFSACGNSDSSNCTDTNSTNTMHTGLTEDSLSGIYDFSDVFLSYRQDIEMLYPYQISTSYSDSEVKDRGHIKFVNKVPCELIEELYMLGYEDNFILTGDGGISQRDNQLRADLVSKALSKVNYHDSSVVFQAGIYFNNKNNKIAVEMIALDESDFLNKEDIINAVVNLHAWSELQGRASILKIDDIEWTYLIGEEHLVIFDESN